MSRSSFRSWCRRVLSPLLGKPQRPRHRSPAKLYLEHLETRVVPAVQPFTLSVKNLTGLPLSDANNIWMAGYTNIEHFHLNQMGKFVANAGTPSDLQSFKFSDLASSEISLDSALTSARIVLMYGNQFTLTRNNGTDIDSPAPSTFPREYYDFVEFTLNDTGLFINTTQVDQFGFPIRLTGNGQSVGVAENVTREQLIQAYIDNVNVQPNGSSFANLVIPPQPPDTYDYRIVSPGLAPVFEWGPYMNGPIRQLFENPGTKLKVQSSVLLGGQFVEYTGEATTYNPFLDPAPPTNNTKVAANNRSYNVLKFTTSTPGAQGPFYIYEPFWKTNTQVNISHVSVSNGVATITTTADHGLVLPQGLAPLTVNIENLTVNPTLNGAHTVVSVPNSTTFTFSFAGAPVDSADSGLVWFGAEVAPSWIVSAGQQNESPGQMVFSGNGVFADQGTFATPGQVMNAMQGQQTTYQLVLANLENQLDTALNRGVANLDYRQFTSSQKPLTKLSFIGDGSVGNRFAAFTTTTPHGFAPSIGEYVSISGLTGTYAVFNRTFSLADVLSATTFKIALAPTDPFVQNGVFTVSGFEQLVNDAQGGDAGVYPNTTWFWVDSNHFYPDGVRQNLYAEGLHNMTATINGQMVSPFINKLVYALSFDDQGKNDPSLFFSTTTPVSVTLGPWAIGASTGKFYAAGADAGHNPGVKVYEQDSKLVSSFLAFHPKFKKGVRVATGDVNRDGIDDVVVAAGPHGRALVKVIDGSKLDMLKPNGEIADEAVLNRFRAYPEKKVGVFLAVADVNADGYEDIVTGADRHWKPEVKVFSGKDGSLLTSFFAFDEEMRHGVRVGAGDTDGDGFADITTSAGRGSDVKVWSGRTYAEVGMGFTAYPDFYTEGIFVAVADVLGDDALEIITGTGRESRRSSRRVGPHVKIFSASGQLLGSFYAAHQRFRQGIRVGVYDTDSDGKDEILTSTGPGPTGLLKVFQETNEIDAFSPFRSHGAFVGG